MAWNPMDSVSRRPCEHFVLARGVVAQIEYCASCEVFHLAIDSMSIRFRATALRDLRDTLSAALSAYEEARQSAATRSLPASHGGRH